MGVLVYLLTSPGLPYLLTGDKKKICTPFLLRDTFQPFDTREAYTLKHYTN
jgi:hypothetical protein